MVFAEVTDDGKRHWKLEVKKENTFCEKCGITLHQCVIKEEGKNEEK